MNCRTIVDIALTGAVALFAGLTWWSSRTYAYIAGLSLFVQTSKEISGTSTGVDRPMAKRTVRVLRKSFPAVYRDMRECLNPETRREVEDTSPGGGS